MTDGQVDDRMIDREALGEGELSAAQREIRAEFVRRRGYWADDWQLILELAPEIMAAYTDCLGVRVGNRLAGREDARVHVHRDHGGGEPHPSRSGSARTAATPSGPGLPRANCVTLLALLGGLGIAGYLLAVDVLEEVSPGSTAIRPGPEERFSELRAEYEKVFGVWDEGAAATIRSDPEFFARFLSLGRGGACFRCAQPASGGARRDRRQRQRHAPGPCGPHQGNPGRPGPRRDPGARSSRSAT